MIKKNMNKHMLVKDLHIQRAAVIFGVPPEEVTREQRQFAKQFNFGLLYSHGAPYLVLRNEE